MLFFFKGVCYLEQSFSIHIYIYILFSALGLRCCAGFFLAAESGGYSRVMVLGLLITVASFVAEHGL